MSMMTASPTPRRAVLTLLAASTLVAAPLAVSLPARADTDPIKQCIAQNDEALALRREGKLLQARRVLAQCATPECGTEISENCQKEAAAVTALIPTIVFATKDGSQRDIVNVKLTIDGVPFEGQLAGNAIPLDPGEHEFRFEVAGEKPVVKRFVLLQGEHERREAILIGPPPPAPPAPPPQQTTVVLQAPQAPRYDHTGSFQRTMGTLLLAVGIPVSVILSLSYGGIALAKKGQAQNDCSSKAVCGPGSQAQNEWSDAYSAATVSTIAGVGFGVALVGGIVLRATAPAPRLLPPNKEALRIEPTFGPNGGGAILTGSFQ
jgi:hypothetical protein